MFKISVMILKFHITCLNNWLKTDFSVEMNSVEHIFVQHFLVKQMSHIVAEQTVPSWYSFTSDKTKAVFL